MKVISIADKFNQFSDYWNPRIIGELNGQHVKLAKIKGEFIWHSHEKEDELFQVIKGQLKMAFRDREEIINEGEIIIVPHGVEHKPIAEEEVHILLFEPKTTINTGAEKNELTKENLDTI